jgi:subtilase family serine protease
MVLRGNTHPMARAEFDRGPAPASLPMDHMLLVLTRSPQQEAALETLLAQQQDRTSPNYHKWLTPEQFGQQFGPSDQDIQTITSWLQSNGFQINSVANGRTTIDFSGTAGAVQQAFHTAIHSYVLANGEQHWANSTDPQIPVALAPVVAGVNSMNNFRRRPMSHSVGVFRRTKADGKVTRISPQFTYAGGCNGNGTNCFAVGPSDFATIYNSQALLNAGINGTGQTIAIVSDSDVSTADVNAFRSLFGLPANNFQRIIPPGTVNPGIQNNASNSDELEAVLDVEWAGAVAPGATIDLVISQSPTTSGSTTFSFGGDFSANYVINNNNTVQASVLSYSYGLCELFLGTAANSMYQKLWSQAAAEGIIVVVATGDNGSAGCENPNPNNVFSPQPATTGLAVNGIGSTPYDVAVGGTDFNDSANPTTYWGNTSGTINSAKGYIPEVAYNDSCTNAILSTPLFGSFSSVAETNCNNLQLVNVFGSGINLIAPFGGGGGPSNCITNATTSTTIGSVSSCSGGYSKPSWQVGTTPADGARDTPDVSLFSGDGFLQNFYVVCEADQDPDNSGKQCNLNSPFQEFVAVGGTSVATQAFAGVVALIDQKSGSRQGNLNPTLYSLAAGQSASNCNASGTPAGNCIFNDVTSGTIAMPCSKGSQNCNVLLSADTIGVLSGYSAASGYDLATGLGSVNICNLVDNWIANFNHGNPTFTLTAASCPSQVVISSPGASNTMTLTVSSVNGFSGTVSTFACSGVPTGASCTFSPTSVAITPASSANVTVTVVTTTASRVNPGDWPKRFDWQKLGEGLRFACVLVPFLFLLWIVQAPRRWEAILSVIVFSVAIALAACGGGSSTGSSATSSSSTTGSTTGLTGLTVATITASSGTTTQQTSFTVNIQ